MLKKDALEMEIDLFNDLLEGVLLEEGYRVERKKKFYKLISPRGHELTIFVSVTG